MIDFTDDVDVEVLHHSGHKGISTRKAQNGVDAIDLASPDGPPCRQDHLVLDNNMAQPSHLDSQPSLELLDEQDAVRARERHKRLWGEMAGEQQHSMQWGSTGPRLHHRRAPMQAHSNAVPGEAAGSAQPLCTTPAAAVRQQPALRRRVIRPRSAQQGPTPKAAAPLVITDDSPAPERSSSAGPHANQARNRQRVDSFQAALAAATLGPQGRSTRPAAAATAPTSIQSNPRLGGQQLARFNAGTAAAAAAGASAAGNRLSCGHRRSSDSIDMVTSSGSGRSGSSDADLARKQQEEEDAKMARRLMEEEQQEAQRQAAQRYRMRAEMYRMQEEAERAAAHAAAAAAMAAATASNRNRRGGRTPTRALQQEDISPGQAQQQPQRSQRWGVAMAQALLQLPRWGMSSASAGGRGIPASLVAMRDAVIGMQRAGLPPHLLFSDRDFTADDYEALCRLDETVENRKGASSNTIAALPTQTVPAGGILGPSGEKLSCAVCLEEFAEGAELRSLPCLHKFHKDCIDRWLGQKACCPVCNQECK